jgi:hypothetical protein
MLGANSCCNRPRRTDGDRGDNLFSLEMLEGGRCPWRDWDAATAAAPSWYSQRPHDSSEIGAIYRAKQERMVMRGRGCPLSRNGTTAPEKMEGCNATPRRGHHALVRARLPGRTARRSVRSLDRTWKCDSGRCRATTACRGEGRLDDGQAHWELDQRRTRSSPRGAFRHAIISRRLGNRFRFEVGWDCPGGARAWTTTTMTTTTTTADNDTDADAQDRTRGEHRTDS